MAKIIEAPHIHQASLRDGDDVLGVDAIASGQIKVTDRTQYGGYMRIPTSFASTTQFYLPEYEEGVDASAFDEYGLTRVVNDSTYTASTISSVGGVGNAQITLDTPITNTLPCFVAIHEPIDGGSDPKLGPTHWDFWRMYLLTPENGDGTYGILDPAIPLLNSSTTPDTFALSAYFAKRGAIENTLAIDGDNVYELQFGTLPVFSDTEEGVAGFMPNGSYYVLRTDSGTSATYKIKYINSLGVKSDISSVISSAAEALAFLESDAGVAMFAAISDKYKTTEKFAVTYDLEANLNKAAYRALKNNSCITDRIKKSREFALWQEMYLIKEAIIVLSDKEAWDDVVDALNRAAETYAYIE